MAETTTGLSPSQAAADAGSAVDRSLPEGWVDHPKIPVTRRAILMGVAVFISAIIVTAASIYFRRTQLELTTKFWGSDTIRAIQLAPSVTLKFDSDADKLPVDLTGTPGLGHLRHALLEQRHYLWETETAAPVDGLSVTDAKFATLVFSDPRTDQVDPVPTATIRLELQEGWVGPVDGFKRVRLIERAQPAVRHFLTMIRNAQQHRSDFRKDG
jgi:hypothetical protein